MSEEFKITEAHIKLARNMYVFWDSCEFGAPSIDCKRPYGNGNGISDIAKILGFPEEPEDGYPETMVNYLRHLHKSMEIALQIFLVTGEFKTGTYIKTEQYSNRSWKPKANK